MNLLFYNAHINLYPFNFTICPWKYTAGDITLPDIVLMKWRIYNNSTIFQIKAIFKIELTVLSKGTEYFFYGNTINIISMKVKHLFTFLQTLTTFRSTVQYFYFHSIYDKYFCKNVLIQCFRYKLIITWTWSAGNYLNGPMSCISKITDKNNLTLFLHYN